MNKIVILLLALCCIVSSPLKAQSETFFEGEIEYETFEMVAEGIQNNVMGIQYNGVHFYRAYIKEDEIHIFDTMTHCHQYVNLQTNTYIMYNDILNYGIVASENSVQSNMNILSNRTEEHKLTTSSKQRITSENYTFKKTDSIQNILNLHNYLWKGNINRLSEIIEEGKYAFTTSVNYIFDIRAWVCADIKMPPSYYFILFGLPIDGLAVNWEYKMYGGDMGKVGKTEFGENGQYLQGKIVSIQNKRISPTELHVPEHIQLQDWMKILVYYTDVHNLIQKLGITDQKSMDEVHVQIDEEWDF